MRLPGNCATLSKRGHRSNETPEGAVWLQERTSSLGEECMTIDILCQVMDLLTQLSGDDERVTSLEPQGL